MVLSLRNTALRLSISGQLQLTQNGVWTYLPELLKSITKSGQKNSYTIKGWIKEFVSQIIPSSH